MRVFRMDADVAGESTTVVLLTRRFDTIFRVSDIAKSVRRDGF